jgi:hypothetical protein
MRGDIAKAQASSVLDLDPDAIFQRELAELSLSGAFLIFLHDTRILIQVLQLIVELGGFLLDFVKSNLLKFTVKTCERRVF